MSSYNLDQSEYCPECEERLDNGRHRVDYIRATRIDPEEYRVISAAPPQPDETTSDELRAECLELTENPKWREKIESADSAADLRKMLESLRRKATQTKEAQG